MKGRIIVGAAALAAIGCLCFFLKLAPAGTEAVQKKKGLTNPFFAFKNGVKDGKHQTPRSQVEMLKELGYAGIEQQGVEGIAEMLEALDATGLKMFTVYVGVWVDDDKQKYNPRLKEAIELLRGRDAIIWLYIRSKEFKPSSELGDDKAVEVIREIADTAHEAGLRVALYPHVGFLVERVEDAVRLAKKANRRNVGVTFNLCHWLAKTTVAEEEDMRSMLESAMPYLFVVSINGADHKAGWENLIQTLDRGSFDNYTFLKTLKELGYAGPIGLQCYGIKGDAYENLKRSMDAWRQLSQRIAADAN